MAKFKSKKKIEVFHYECTLTGETFKTNREAKSPDELVSVNAWYEMNPDEDDRPEVVLKALGVQQEEEQEESKGE